MKLQTTKTAMLAAVSAASRVISTKNAMPICESVRIWKGMTGNWFVTGGNAEIQATVALQVTENVAEPENVCIQAQKLVQTLMSLPEAPITLETKGGQAVLKCGKGKYKMNCCDDSEYPTMDAPEGDITVIRIAGSVFVQNIKAGLVARAEDILRPQMGGVALDVKEGRVTFVASDGHRMYTYTSEAKRNGGTDDIIIIPGDVAKAVDTLFRQAGEVTVVTDGKRIALSAEGVVLVASAMTGRYPNYRSVIPDISQSNTIVVNVKDMIAALQRCAIFASDNTQLVAMSTNMGTMTLQAEDIDFARGAEEEVSTEHCDCPDSLRIGFHIGHMIALLKNVKTQNAVLKVTAANRPIVLLEDNESHAMLELQMPMLIQ